MPIIFLISSAVIFFGYVNPNYRGGIPTNSTGYQDWSVTSLQDELNNYNSIANSSTKIVSERDILIKKMNSIGQDKQDRLQTLLPNNVDNIRLLIEINQMANRRSLILKNISFSQAKGSDSSAAYGTVSLKFTVNSTYSNFLQFLSDLESNLRLLDVTDISFTSTDSGLYDFNVGLNTYWLK
jgi:Tfp pilus assembly protein PilO